jgi:hypothetical protein
LRFGAAALCVSVTASKGGLTVRFFRFAVLAWTALVLASCNCGGLGSLGERTDCGDFAPVLDSYCGAIERCPSLYPIATRSRQECIDVLCWALTCHLESDRVGGVRTYTIEQNKPVVDQSRVSGCTSYLNTATCEALASDMNSSSSSSSGTTQPRNACDGLFSFEDSSSGGVGAGANCESDSCQSGLYCERQELNRDAGALTCRTCKVLPAVGEKCASQSPSCATGLVCDNSTTGTCILPKPDGDSCTSSEVCLSKFCNQGTKVCDPNGQAGDACTQRQDCRMGFCNSAGACEDLHKNGTACTANDQCLNYRCETATGVCGVADGTTCQMYNHSMCASGFCDGTILKCAPRKADGTACTDANECLSDYCNFSTRTCQPHCNSDTECAAGEYCDSSAQRCQTLRDDGQACSDSDQCKTGNCRSNDTCGKRPGIGDACTLGECYPAGYCSNGICQKGKGPGEACEAIDQCQAPYICREKTCQAMNLACRPGKLNEGCAYLRVCDSATYCDTAAGFVCKAKKAAGATCTQAEECSAGFTCISSTCTARGGEGTTCSTSNDCTEGFNCVRSSSGTGSTCVAPPAGTPCEYDKPCPSGYWCNTSGDVCEPRKASGARCSGSTSSSECADGLYCDSTCKPLNDVDAGCASYRPCKPELHCDSNTSKCEIDATLGQPCTGSSSSDECAPELYCNTNMSPYACAQKQGTGGACTSDEQCLSGDCYSGYGCLAGDQCVMP